MQAIRRETFLIAVDMGCSVQESLGIEPGRARNAVTRFAEHDVRRFNEHHGQHNDEAKMRELANEGARELEEMFIRDASDKTHTNP